jgi:probable poly-beta-1,6-N-acetyl-D-glucosamine export protein
MTRRFLYLNGVAVLGVVGNHVLAWCFIALFWWAHRYRPVESPNFDQMYSFTYYALRFLEQIIITSIPAFLLVSGFFVAFATRKGAAFPGWAFIGTRIRYLVIPYLIWSIVYLGANFVQGQRYTAMDLARILLMGQATAAFYFIPLLVQLYLLSPLLSRLARERWKLLLGIAFLVQAAVAGTKYLLILNPEPASEVILTNLTAGWFFPGNLFWFSAGIVIGFHHAEVKQFLTRLRWVWLGLALALLPAGIMEWEWLLANSGQVWITPRDTLLDMVYNIFVLAAFIGFMDVKLPLARWLGDLGSKSFGVYLSHSLVLEAAARGLYHQFPVILGVQIVFFPLVFAAGLGVPLLLMAAAKRTPLSRYYAYLFG